MIHHVIQVTSVIFCFQKATIKEAIQISYYILGVRSCRLSCVTCVEQEEIRNDPNAKVCALLTEQ